ncbi:MAG: MBOAT family protein, partial [Bacteroidales bacterium]|nr:MBOAT family protein [Bacteroidales bacterium]
MDVYRRRIQPVNSWLDYGFYVSFFPQLVAGPIVRANTFIPQIYKPFHLSRRQFGIAIFWILNGLVKKIVLSDYLAVNFIDRVFANPTMYSGFENLFSLFAYSLQVYADFSGYTDIAIGVAMLMGFYLPQNFNSPYKASNAGNFWKRWHISLSRWLQEYLYIPLGGNRKATFGTYFWIIAMALIAVALSRSLWLLFAVVLALGLSLFSTRRDADKRRRLTTNLNSLNTMLLGGLWHGASLNFVIWGGLNGAGVIIYKTWKNWSPLIRTLVMLSLFVAVYLSGTYIYPCAALNIAKIWIGLLCIGTLVRYMYHLFQTLSDKSLSLSVEAALSKVWGIAQTFVFITFTRLFFRSGSNLDPAEANRVAWETAVNMIEQIGGAWDVEIIPQVIQSYAAVFVLFILGMIIHWLPQNWKRRYRLAFAKLPIACMVLLVVAVVFFVYQFITADLQAFIYFQF